MKDVAEIKKEWFKSNLMKLVLTALVVFAPFIFAVALHKVWLVIIGIVLTFSAFFYYRNRFAGFMEKHLYQ